MTRIQLACYGLIGSAFVLAALLVVQMESKRVLPTAQADQVITRGSITAMTARTSGAEESLFILDNVNQRLLVYQTVLQGARGQLNLVESIPLDRLFAGAGAGAQGGNVRGGAGNVGGGRRPR